jgi:hypothetical protein
MMRLSPNAPQTDTRELLCGAGQRAELHGSSSLPAFDVGSPSSRVSSRRLPRMPPAESASTTADSSTVVSGLSRSNQTLTQGPALERGAEDMYRGRPGTVRGKTAIAVSSTPR